METKRLRVNVPLLLATVAVITASSAGIHVLHAYQIERNAETVLARAVAARDDKEHKLAIKLYAEYLGLKPGDTSGAQSQMAELLDDTARTAGEFARAFTALETASRHEPDRQDIRRRLVLVSMKLQRYQVAKAHWSKLADTPDGETAFLGGQIRQALGDYRGAARSFLAAIEHAPEKIDYYLDLVSLVQEHADDVPLDTIDPLHEESPDAALVADRLLEALVAQGEPKARAYCSRAAVRKRQGSLDDAFEDIRNALELCEDAATLTLGASIGFAQVEAARLEGRASDVERHRQSVRDLAERGLNLTPPDTRFFLTLSQVEKQQGRPDEAEEQLRQGLSQLRANSADDVPARRSNIEIQLRWSLADLLLDRADLETGAGRSEFQAEAQSLIKDLREMGALAALLDFLDARVLLSRRHWHEASVKLEETRSYLSDLPDLLKQVDLSLGLCYEKLGNPEAKVGALRRAVTRDPLWVAGRMHLATALLAVNRRDEALAEYRRLIGSVVEAPLACAQLLIVQNLNAPARQREWNEIDALLTLAERAQPDNPQTMIARSTVLILQQKHAAAQSLLEQALQERPRDTALVAALANLWLRRDDLPLSERLERAREVLDAAQESQGDLPELLLAKIVVAGQSPQEEAARRLTDLAANLERFSQSDRIAILKQIALAYGGIRMPDKALAIWRDLSSAQPDDLSIRLMIVDLAAQTQDERKITECLKEIRQIEGPNGPNGDFVEGSLLVQKASRDKTWFKDLGRAGELLRQAGKGRSYWPAVPRMLGMLEDLVGNRDGALDHYRQAVELGDRSPQAVSLLVGHLYEQQRYEEADLKLRQLSEQQPGLLTGEVARLASVVAWERHDFDRALQLAGDVADHAPEFRDLIRLSQFRMAHGEQGESVEKPLREAIVLAPMQPEPHIALVTLLARTDRAKEAESAIQQALKTLPRSIAHLTAARCFDVINARKQARENYLKALEQSPDDVSVMSSVAEFYIRTGDTNHAEKLLLAIVDPQRQAPEPAVALARRRLALVTAFKGGYENTVAALEMVNQGKARNRPIEVADLRVKAAILSRRNTRQDKRLLIETWKEIGTRQPLSPAEQFEMARLYESIESWSRAREILQSLLLDGRGNVFLLTHAVQSQIAHNELDEAARWLAELEIVAPQSFAATALKARWLAAQGESDEAAELLQAFVRENPSTSLVSAATLMNELGHPQAAAALLEEQRSALDAAGRFALATLRARNGNIDQALEVCEEAQRLVPKLAAAQMSVGVLRATTPNARQIELVKRWLRKWLETEPDSTVLLNYMANVCDLERNYDEAESYYSAVLIKDPGDVVALNNAAHLAGVLRGKGAESLELINRAIRIVGPVAELLDTRAAAYLALNDPQHAIREVNNSLDEKPSPSAYIRLAQAHSLTNNRRAARTAIHKAKELLGPATNLHPLDAAAYRGLVQQLK